MGQVERDGAVLVVGFDPVGEVAGAWPGRQPAAPARTSYSSGTGVSGISNPRRRAIRKSEARTCAPVE